MAAVRHEPERLRGVMHASAWNFAGTRSESTGWLRQPHRLRQNDLPPGSRAIYQWKDTSAASARTARRVGGSVTISGNWADDRCTPRISLPSFRPATRV